MNTFTCKCGLIVKEGEEPKDSLGLLKSLSAQVDLEAFQAKELANFVTKDEKEKWLNKHFGAKYPKDTETEELIEDFLYTSHRKNGCSATFLCPSCGRLAILHEEGKEWQFYAPETKA